MSCHHTKDHNGNKSIYIYIYILQFIFNIHKTVLSMSTHVKCKIGLWFLSSALRLINIYVCIKFNFNPFCTFQDMARTRNHNKING